MVLVLTDAEEACLCGAKAFVDQHPLARDGGVVLNLEARGSSGPAIMFETVARTTPAWSTSYAQAPAPGRHVVRGRDLPAAAERHRLHRRSARPGFAGLNTAYIDGAAVYHAPADTPAAMDRDSLQHHGDNALALTRGARRPRPGRRWAAAATPPTSRCPAGWSATPARWSGRSPCWRCSRCWCWAGWPGGAGWPPAGGWSRGFGLALVPIVVAPLLAQLLWAAAHADPPGLRRAADRPVPPVLVPAGGRGADRRRSSSPGTPCCAAGSARPRWPSAASAGWPCSALVLAAFAPGGSYLAALPALAGALAGIAALLLARLVGGARGDRSAARSRWSSCCPP